MTESANSSKKLPKVWVILVVLLLGLVIAYVLFRFLKKIQTQKQTVRPDNTDEQGNVVPVDWQYVYGTALSYTNDKDSAITIAAIARHETGDFTSAIYMTNNNLFGMRMPQTRDTVAEYEKNGYAYYSDAFYSIDDLMLWFKFHNYDIAGKSYEEIVDFMKEKSYFEASLTGYKNAVKKWRNAILNNFDV